jgi:hypothetical protein
MAPVGRGHGCWSGHGEISSTWFSAVKRRANRDRKGMNAVPVRIDITIEDCWELFKEQDRKCVYTGLVLHFPVNSTHKANRDATASLDRIDSSKGYVKGNIQFVHKHINMMKNTYEEDYFLEMCHLVSKNTKWKKQDDTMKVN